MDEILSKNVSIDIHDEYRVGDEIYLRLEGDAYISGAPATLTVPPAPGMKGVTLDYRAQSTEGGDTILVYRVSVLSEVNVTDTTIGINFDFGRFNFDAQKVVAQNGVVFSTFSRPEDDKWVPGTTLTAPVYTFDEVSAPMSDTTQLFKMGDQYYLDIAAPFEGELDVWDFRRSFRDEAPGSTYGDQVWNSMGVFWVRTTNNPDGGAWDYEVDVDPGVDEEILFTLSGDNMFGWIASVDPTVGMETILATNGCEYVSHTANDFKFRCDDVDVPTDLVFDLMSANPDSGQNPKQDGDFMLSATVNWYNFDTNYTGAVEDGVLLTDPYYGETDLGAVLAGEWTVNGSITHIPYMPFSKQAESGQVTPISQIIYVTNDLRDPGFDDVLPGGNPDNGNGEGPAPENPNVDRIIWVEAMGEDGTIYGPYQLEALANPGVTSIAGEVREFLFQDGALNSSGKFSLTVNVADYPTNISVYSAYNVNGSDRGWVQNDSVRTDVDLYKGNGIID
ncbi:hypothetical protein CWI80_04230 [Pseudidiomarina sediminum]|uniref:Uncharacterized protein n=2 Tax=Pseudidiomarina sediminum TaxID=431675 RepID=A0A432Z9E4_9GAMM|nr:hypothetical protein CWI80_04230 [Pseudidiomarina sediminum]